MGKQPNTVKGEALVEELAKAGYQAGVAVATEAEVAAGAACGQIAFEHKED